jgi:FkbM family methyltransferase
MFPQFLIPAGRALLDEDHITALDIGGAYGLQPHWERFVGNSLFFMFEPHPESYNELLARYRNDPNGKFFRPLPYALAEKDGKTLFYATNCPTGSSLLKPNKQWKYHSDSDPYYYPLKELEIEALSLNTALNQECIQDIDVIKMDTQGAELSILRGLDENRLNKTLLVELEILFEPFYENSSRLADVENFMNDHGLEMYDVRVVRSARKIPALQETYNKRVFQIENHDPSVAQKIGEIDCIYIRKSDPLIHAKDIKKLNRLIFTFCVYNFFADAMLLLDEMLVSSLIDQNRYNVCKQIIVEWQKLNKAGLGNLEQSLKSLGWQNYGQYTWVPYPSS